MTTRLTLACVLLAAAGLRAQILPEKNWNVVQALAGAKHKTRVTVITASGKVTGRIRAAESDRVVVGDDANTPTIIARDDVCEIETSPHRVRPRTTVLSLLAGGALATVVVSRAPNLAARFFAAAAMGAAVGSTSTRPPHLLYSNPDCSDPGT